MTDSISLGIIFGLVFGKVLGICLFVKIMQVTGIAILPKDVTFDHIIGAGLLAGIGFTMSIFISDLAFEWDSEVIVMAKMGILIASIISGIMGYYWLNKIAVKNYISH